MINYLIVWSINKLKAHFSNNLRASGIPKSLHEFLYGVLCGSFIGDVFDAPGIRKCLYGALYGLPWFFFMQSSPIHRLRNCINRFIKCNFWMLPKSDVTKYQEASLFDPFVHRDFPLRTFSVFKASFGDQSWMQGPSHLSDPRGPLPTTRDEATHRTTSVCSSFGVGVEWARVWLTKMVVMR